MHQTFILNQIQGFQLNNSYINLSKYFIDLIMSKNYWLLKSEPSTWSWEDQVKSRIDMWDGVRNYQARNNLMKMKRETNAFFIIL